MRENQRYFLDLVSREPGAFQKTLDTLDTAQKKKLLLEPLSEDTRENALSYIVADRFADTQEWRAPFLNTALDAIENLDITAAQRVALLTSANELGQTLFHKALKSKQLFDILEQRLRTWGGNDYADTFMKNFLSEPLGTIDDNVSKILNAIHLGLFPYGSEDRERIGSLGLGRYQPATYKGLKSVIEKVRPQLRFWTERYLDGAANPRLAPRVREGELLKAFTYNPDWVMKGEPPKRPASTPADKPAAPTPPAPPKP
jgi:hypothetical protein